jgi:hypothetical protein
LKVKDEEISWHDIYKKSVVGVLISDFKTKKVLLEKAGQFVTIKGSTHQEDLTIVGINVLNNRMCSKNT